MNIEEYNHLMEVIKRSKHLKKCKKYYRNIRNYNVIIINDEGCLTNTITYNNNNIQYYVKNKELFDLLHCTHMAIGHRDRGCMIAEIN